MVQWRPTRPLRTNNQKRLPFNYRGLECKNRRSRDTWCNRKIQPWNTKWSREKANRVLPRECTDHSKHLLPTTTRDDYTWISPGGQYQNQTDYSLCSQRWRDSIQSAKTRLWIEHFIAKFRLKMKKIRKTTRPFRCNLNQIPYDYTVDVTSRFKGSDLIRVPEEIWMEVGNIVQKVVIKINPKKKKCRKTNGCLSRSYYGWENNRCERQRKKGKIYQSECRAPQNSKER